MDRAANACAMTGSGRIFQACSGYVYGQSRVTAKVDYNAVNADTGLALFHSAGRHGKYAQQDLIPRLPPEGSAQCLSPGP